jgi:aspartyl-tRNA synthetase
MIDDCHAHVGVPARHRAFEAMLLSHRGAHGRGRVNVTDEPNISEVTLLPMNRQAQDLMMQAPAPVPDDRLEDVHIRRSPPPAPKPADG